MVGTLKDLAAAALIAIVVFWLARAAGIPAWRDWQPGDATDCAVFAFTAVRLLTGRRR